MNTITKQAFGSSAGIPYRRKDKRRHKKGAVERHRRWLHGVFWSAFFMIVVMTKPSTSNPHIRRLFEIVSYALITAATVGRLWCSLYVRGRKSKELCQDGPYAICRNPLYVCSFLGGMGVAVVSGHAALMIGLPILFWGYYFLVIKSEEKRLTQVFGKEYQAYCGKVPRIIPKFGKYWTRTTVAVTPNHYLRGIMKSIGYFWIVFVLQLVEGLKLVSY